MHDGDYFTGREDPFVLMAPKLACGSCHGCNVVPFFLKIGLGVSELQDPKKWPFRLKTPQRVGEVSGNFKCMESGHPEYIIIIELIQQQQQLVLCRYGLLVSVAAARTAIFHLLSLSLVVHHTMQCVHVTAC